MDTELLNKLHKIECEMLRDIDSFCQLNEIDYSLTGGNLIGAIRHQGFIPWDDDMDIIMTRNNYLKFKELWSKDVPEKYENVFECSPVNGLTHSKIFLKNTTLCSKKELKQNKPHGIWIDLFVLDKIPLDDKKRKQFLWWAKFRMLLCRKNVYQEGNLILRLISFFFVILPWSLKKTMIKKANFIIYRYKDNECDFEFIELASPKLLGFFYSPDLIKNGYKKCDYSGYSFSIFSNYDLYLKNRFGDYMTLPPENERVCKHNPEVVIFDNTKE